MLVFIHNLGSFAGRHKRHHTKEGLCPGPWSSPWYHQPQAWEDGREIEVLHSVYRAGRILHIHIFSPINSMFPTVLKLNNKELTCLLGTSLITWAICTPPMGGSSHVTSVKVTGRTPSLLQSLFPELSYHPVLKGILLTHSDICASTTLLKQYVAITRQNLAKFDQEFHISYYFYRTNKSLLTNPFIFYFKCVFYRMVY